ncbi:MAG: hypothetical protein IJZ28_04815 [Clostridia bacterium]|nr:hypothetical protein [Clostridia bacterium]
MKKTKVISIICIMLVALCCFTACGDDSYNAKGAKSVTITATLTHPDGVLLQKIESNFTKDGKVYSYVTKTTAINSLDSGSNEMYSTETKEGTDAKLNVPSWLLDDFAAIYQASETSIRGKVKDEKVASIGIADAEGDVNVVIEFNEKQLTSMTVEYTNTKGAAVVIVVTMSY